VYEVVILFFTILMGIPFIGIAVMMKHSIYASSILPYEMHSWCDTKANKMSEVSHQIKEDNKRVIALEDNYFV